MSASPLDRVRDLLPLRPGLVNLVASVMQGVFFCLYFRKEGLFEFEVTFGTVMILLYSFLTLNVLVQLANTLAGGRRWVWFCVGLGLMALQGAFLSYRHTMYASFDFDILADNIALAATSEGLGMIRDGVGGAAVLLGILALAALFFVLELRWRLLSRQRQRRPALPKICAGVVIYGAVLVLPVDTFDELGHFNRTMAHHLLWGDELHQRVPPGTYPLVVERQVAVQQRAQRRRPHIFLVLVESFNAGHVGARTPSGAAITPVFDKLIKRGVYLERFYGNSVQTSKGQLALLFSVIPSISGKVFVHHRGLRLFSLPRALQDSGYRTLFIQAYKDTGFDNTGPFLTQNGFDDVRSIFGHLRPGDEQHSWGWGLQDEVFYTRCFEVLDRQQRDRGARARPLFVTLSTIGNHTTFDKMPANRRLLHRDPKSFAEHYANSLHLSDRALARFFSELNRRDYLKDSLVVITGDHGFPVAEHGFVTNAGGFYDEFFRTPMLLIWEDRLAPRVLRDVPFSQLDLAPSLVDLLQLPLRRHHFAGVSFFQERRRPHPIYLIQPYNGRYLGVVVSPHKYVLHRRSGREFLFHLGRDPMERTNLAKEPSLRAIKARLREALGRVLVNQQLIKQDAIWPGR